MINSENSSIDELLTIDTIKNNILPKYSIYNADINTVKIKDTTKQRAVFKINYNNNCYCIKKVYYDEANLLFVYSAMEWLYRNGIILIILIIFIYHLKLLAKYIKQVRILLQFLAVSKDNL